MPVPGHPIGGPTKESNARVADYYRDQAIIQQREVRRLTDELVAVREAARTATYVITVGDRQVAISGESTPGMVWEFRDGSETLMRVEVR